MNEKTIFFFLDYSILPKSDFLVYYPISFYAVLESTKERLEKLGFWKWLRNR